MKEIIPTGATQGLTHEENEDIYGADIAIDQDLSTPAAIVPKNGETWFKLHFDRTHFIRKIIIYWKFSVDWYFPGDGCKYSTWCVSKDTGVEVSVYQGEVKQKSCGTLRLKEKWKQSDQIYTLLCEAEGDTVKLNKTKGNINLYEIVAVSLPGK